MELNEGRRTVRFGHQMNAWGGVIGHPAGVTSIKDLFYLTPGDPVGHFADVAAAGYQGVEVFDGDLAAYAWSGPVARIEITKLP